VEVLDVVREDVAIALADVLRVAVISSVDEMSDGVTDSEWVASCDLDGTVKEIL
jgi:hypothetical protein